MADNWALAKDEYLVVEMGQRTAAVMEPPMVEPRVAWSAYLSAGVRECHWAVPMVLVTAASLVAEMA